MLKCEHKAKIFYIYLFAIAPTSLLKSSLFKEPENDPRNYVYYWVVRSEREESVDGIGKYQS